MIPVTHAFYLASLLLLLGLLGLLRRRAWVFQLLSLQLLLAAAQLALVAAARIWAGVDGHALALLAIAGMAAQGALGAGLLLQRRRAPGRLEAAGDL